MKAIAIAEMLCVPGSIAELTRGILPDALPGRVAVFSGMTIPTKHSGCCRSRGIDSTSRAWPCLMQVVYDEGVAHITIMAFTQMGVISGQVIVPMRH